MGYTPPRKKKNWWEEAIDDVGGFFSGAKRTVAKAADAVLPGDQSSWHRENTPARTTTQRRTDEPIVIRQQRPQVVATFSNEKPDSVAALESNQVQGIDIDSKNQGLQVKPAITNQGSIRVEAPQAAVQRLSVAPAVATPAINVAQDPDVQRINQGLDRGESWEKIAKDSKIDFNKVKEYSQRTRPSYGIAEKPKNNFTSYTMDEGKNKTVFGMDVSGIIPGEQFDKTYGVKVGGHEAVTDDQFLKFFDTRSKEFQKIYVGRVKELADSGDYAAQNTLATLERSGRMKGDLMDFIEGSNDRLYGGMARTTARTIEMLPGDQGAGAWADKDAKNNAQFTQYGKAGEMAGSVQKGVVDVASILAPSMAAEKALKGTKFVQGLSQGDRVRKLLGYTITNVGSGAVGTGVEAFQTHGRGDDQDLVKSAGIAAAIDFAAPAALKGLGRGLKFGFDAMSGTAGAQGIDAATDVLGAVPGSTIDTTRSVVTDLIEETDPKVIQQALGVSEPVAQQLAQETSEEAVVETLRRLEVDPSINISPEVRERMEREGITEVRRGDSDYAAHYDRNGRITVRDDENLEENLYHEIGHHVWLNRLSPDEKAAFAQVNGRASQEAKGRAGYSADDLASEDFSDFTRLALTGRLAEVPESVRGIVAKYAGVVDNGVKQAEAAPVNTPRANVPIFAGKLDNLTQSKIDELFKLSEATPRPPGTTRVFQDPGQGAGNTNWVFDNIDSLAAYRNNVTSPTDRYVFHDVPNGSLQPTGNGEHVYQMTQLPNQVRTTTVKSGNNLDLGTDARARFANRELQAQTPAAEISAKYGGKVEDIQRNIDRYGEEAVRNMYASKSDSPTINNIDAVATSELRKMFGKARVTGAPGGQMTPEELASLEASAPNVAKSIDEPQPMTEWADEYNGRDPRTPEEIAAANVPPDLPPPPDAPNVPAGDPRNSPLGTMAQAFYDARTGNTPIKFRDIENLGKEVSKEIDKAFKQAGSDFPSVARRVEEARRNGATSLDQVDLTDVEKDLWLRAEAEMDYVRRRASLGRREIGEGDFGDLYFPNQNVDAYPTRETLFEGFRDTKPGNEIKRTDAIDLDRLNYNPEVVGGYITRYSDTKLMQEERIYRAMEKNNPNLPEEQIREAAQDVINLQNKVNSVKTKIQLGGLGKRVTVTKDGVVDFAEEMNTIGQKLGKEQLTVNGTPRGLTNGDRLNSVNVTYKGEVHTVGDFLGLNQFRDSGAYAGTQVIESGGDRGALANMVYERLQRDYRLPADDVEYLVESVNRIAADVPEQVVAARVEAIYRNAAKQQLMEQLQNVNLANKTLKNDVSRLATQIVREGTVEQELSSKVVSKTLRATNALFRKLNVSSALNEMSDLTSLYAVYGKNLKAATPDFSLIKKYNVGEIDPAIEPYLRQIGEGANPKSVLSKVNEATRLYKLVETYKAGVALKTAEDFYSARGLTGDELTQAVLKDFRELTLPVDAFTKTVLDNYPLWTQYLTWGARNMQKEGRLLTGQIDAGLMADKSVGQRIARDLYANIPAKTLFWLASNGLKGTTIMTAFGLTDFTGLTSQDYSGIQEEDKSLFDRTTQFTNISTIGSLINTTIQHYEKEQLKNSDKYKNADYNPYEHNNFAGQVKDQYTPQFLKNALGANELMDKGYSENKAGRVQYEAPTDAWNTFKAYAFGKNQTANAREYSGRENLVDRMQEGKNPVQAVTDMAKEQIGLQATDYNRPLTDEYSERYKAIDREARTALLAGGRQYNDYLDNLKKNEPDAYNNYIAAMDGNHVNPEFWREVTADPKTFDMMRDRKKQLFKDLGTEYDPIYDLPSDQASAVLKYKSAPTGDDLALRNVLNKEQWYKDFKDRTKAYYAKMGDRPESDFKTTERVKEWEALDDKLSSFYFDKDAKEAPAWGKDFPLVLANKQIIAQYGFDSPESKAFFKANADAYQAQKEGYDKAQLDVINAMRAIEGVPPMSWEAYQQATEIADTDASDDKKKGWKNWGDNDRASLNAPGGSFGRARAIDLDTVKVNVPKVAVKRKGGTPGKISVKKGQKLR